MLAVPETDATSWPSTTPHIPSGRDDPLLRALCDQVTDPLFIKDLHGRYLFLNRTGTEFFDDIADGTAAHTDTDVVTATDREGVARHIQWTRGVLRDTSQRVIGTFGIGKDVTALIASENRYQRLFEASPTPMYVYDAETLAFLAVNDAAVEHYGYSREEFLRLRVPDIRPPEDVPALLQALAVHVDGRTRTLRRHRTKGGRVIHVDVTSHAITLDGRLARLVHASDMTERVELEARVRQAHKMEAIGQLADGIAHDFGNLLTVIIAGAECVGHAIPTDDRRSRALMDDMRTAANQGAALVRQLMTFSRQPMAAPSGLDINRAVRDAEPLLRRLVRKDITMTCALAPSLPPALVDPGQLYQVLMNLIVNASDAMPDGGTITVTTAPIRTDEDPSCAASLRLSAGTTYVRIAVADTGQGMDAATKARIFEPFFTTKGLGKGTGLGLSTVYGIVAQSRGALDVRSAPGLGSTFVVYLPTEAIPCDGYLS
jgi:two-component system cell cycle sensor histidine kinase/response regulator CckA